VEKLTKKHSSMLTNKNIYSIIPVRGSRMAIYGQPSTP